MSIEKIDNRGNLIIEDARLIYRNFSGAASRYNHEGDRNFCVFIDNPDVVKQLQDEGWNVKIRQPRDEGDSAANYLKVNVSYKFKGPKIVRHIGRTAFDVDESTVAELDMDELESCDLVVAPYHWERDGETGTSGFLQTMHAVVKQDPFYNKYNENLDISAPAEFPAGTK